MSATPSTVAAIDLERGFEVVRSKAAGPTEGVFGAGSTIWQVDREALVYAVLEAFGELGHRECFTKADSQSAAFFKRSGSRSPDAAASSRALAKLPLTGVNHDGQSAREEKPRHAQQAKLTGNWSRLRRASAAGVILSVFVGFLVTCTTDYSVIPVRGGEPRLRTAPRPLCS